MPDLNHTGLDSIHVEGITQVARKIHAAYCDCGGYGTPDYEFAADRLEMMADRYPHLAHVAADSESDEYPDATHRTLPYAVWTKFPDESVEVIQMSGRDAVVAVRRIKSDTSETDEHTEST